MQEWGIFCYSGIREMLKFTAMAGIREGGLGKVSHGKPGGVYVSIVKSGIKI